MTSRSILDYSDRERGKKRYTCWCWALRTVILIWLCFRWMDQQGPPAFRLSASRLRIWISGCFSKRSRTYQNGCSHRGCVRRGPVWTCLKASLLPILVNLQPIYQTIQTLPYWHEGTRVKSKETVSCELFSHPSAQLSHNHWLCQVQRPVFECQNQKKVDHGRSVPQWYLEGSWLLSTHPCGTSLCKLSDCTCQAASLVGFNKSATWARGFGFWTRLNGHKCQNRVTCSRLSRKQDKCNLFTRLSWKNQNIVFAHFLTIMMLSLNTGGSDFLALLMMCHPIWYLDCRRKIIEKPCTWTYVSISGIL